jgi:hypothetical protein
VKIYEIENEERRCRGEEIAISEWAVFYAQKSQVCFKENKEKCKNESFSYCFDVTDHSLYGAVELCIANP